MNDPLSIAAAMKRIEELEPTFAAIRAALESAGMGNATIVLRAEPFPEADSVEATAITEADQNFLEAMRIARW
jgi:hypothetical protein